jgi:hypothetical protein
MFHFLRFAFLATSALAYTSSIKPSPKKANVVPQQSFATVAASATLAALLVASEPAMAMSTTAAQIHLNSLPPTTISVQISDVPVLGKLLSGTYSKVDSSPAAGKAAVTIKSPPDKFAAFKNFGAGGHLEFDVDGLLQTHLDVDVAASKAGVVTFQVASPLIPQLPFKNSASGSVAQLLTVEKSAGPSKTAAKVSLNSLPPSAISIEIGDLPVFGKLLSGTYTKVESAPAGSSASVTIESPKDRLRAVREVATGGHLEFDVDGLLATHLDVDFSADRAGMATVKVASPLIPQLPFKNKASI